MSDVEILGRGVQGVVYREGEKIFKISFDDSALDHEYEFGAKIHESEDEDIEKVKKYFLKIYGVEEVKVAYIPEMVIKEMEKYPMNKKFGDRVKRMEMEYVAGKSFLTILYKLFEEEISDIFSSLEEELKDVSDDELRYTKMNKFIIGADLPKDKVEKINYLFIIVINKILKALHVTHERLSIIHGDLWDYNVLISEADPKIIDYGRAEESKELCIDISELIRSWFDPRDPQCYRIWHTLNWNKEKLEKIRKKYYYNWGTIYHVALRIFIKSLRETGGLVNYIDIACIVILEKDCTHDVKKTNLEILQDIEDEVKIAKLKV